MASTIYAIDEELYCFWANDLREASLRFLEDIDPVYFGYIADLAIQQSIDDKNAMRVAANLRLSFFHGAESLLMLLAALIQAPLCPQAYLGQCSNGNLRSVLLKITQGEDVRKFNYSLLNISWDEIAYEVLKISGESGDRLTELAKFFGDFWTQLSSKQLDAIAIAEYNSIKHGFRVGQGGYKIHLSAVNPTDTEPKEITIGGSRFGTSFDVIDRACSPAKGNRSRLAKRHSVNWNLEELAELLQLISASMQNVISYLKSYNGASPPYTVALPNNLSFPSVLSESFVLTEAVHDAIPTSLEEVKVADDRNRARRARNEKAPGAEE
jgi:hypothetical protein